MFTQLLSEHFVQTALWAGAVGRVVSGAIGVFVVARGMSFAVHADLGARLHRRRGRARARDRIP